MDIDKVVLTAINLSDPEGKGDGALDYEALEEHGIHTAYALKLIAVKMSEIAPILKEGRGVAMVRKGDALEVCGIIAHEATDTKH